MNRVFLCDVERAGLARDAALRGIAIDHVRGDPVEALRRDRGYAAGMLASCPHGAALDAVRLLRRGGCTLPLMLLVADGEGAAVRALDAGADDTILLPASDALIAARLSALLRRRVAASRIVLGSLTIDTVERRVAREGCEIMLLPREYRLLLHLARHAGAIVSRAELLASVWGLDFDPGTNVIEVHVSRLRAKLDRGFAAPMLLTEKRRGYRLVADAQSPIAGLRRAV